MSQQDHSISLELTLRPSASRFVTLATEGAAREVAAFGTRGDGKTWAALIAMIEHATKHHERGGELPTKWLGAADTFQSHKSKTHESLTAPGWGGGWRLRDDGHLAAFRVSGVELVHLRLFGVEDQSGMDRLRAECHGLWFEEPAPSSVLVQSSGLSESAWGLGLTSQRLASYCHPAIMTLNYPDEDHWTWQRFVERRHPGTAYVRIPPGERASAEQRAEWAEALSNRPDMLRRLIGGQPGSLYLGDQVASGFNLDVHVAKERPEIDRHGKVYVGQDGGLTPATVIGQRIKGQVVIHAGLVSEHAGMRQHVEQLVRPWFAEHMPWVLSQSDRSGLRVCYDPSLNTDDAGNSESNPLLVLRKLLPATYVPGPIAWKTSRYGPGRLDPLLSTIGLADVTGLYPRRLADGRPLFTTSPDAKMLNKALGGAWYRNPGTDEPHKPNHPHEDLGDATCYILADMAPLKEPAKPDGRQRYAESARSAWERPGTERFAEGAESAW
jgi:hypothetical protein